MAILLICVGVFSFTTFVSISLRENFDENRNKILSLFLGIAVLLSSLFYFSE